jgi:hypothetical protein
MELYDGPLMVPLKVTTNSLIKSWNNFVLLTSIKDKNNVTNHDLETIT